MPHSPIDALELLRLAAENEQPPEALSAIVSVILMSQF